MTLFDIGAVSRHRRKYIRKVGQLGGEILLDKQVDRVTAGGYHDIPVLLRKHSFVLRLDYRRADRGLLDIGKAQLFQRVAHGFDPRAVVVCDKGGRKAYIDRRTGLEHDLDLFKVTDYLLGTLRADDEALSAKDAFLGNNMRLIARKADGFYRAVAYALVAVLTVGFFQRQAD